MPPSYIRVRAVVWAYGRGQTDTQTCMTAIHFASSTTHAKCNKTECILFSFIAVWLIWNSCITHIVLVLSENVVSSTPAHCSPPWSAWRLVWWWSHVQKFSSLRCLTVPDWQQPQQRRQPVWLCLLGLSIHTLCCIWQFKLFGVN